MIKVLVIIVTYNSIRWIDNCINSVLSSKQRCSIYVIDNGSTDGTQEYIKNNFSEIIFYQSGENIGFGKANNIGIQYAYDNNFDYVYLLNQDAWIFPDTLEKLIECNKKNPIFGILSPIQLQANLHFMDNNFASIVCAYSSNLNIINDFYFERKVDVYSVSFVMAAHWLISRECFTKVGGFSHTFPHYGEDNNYIDRALYHGFNVGIASNSKAVHDREDRVETKHKLIYIDYITSLVKISNINKLCTYPLMICIINTFISIVKHKSLKPCLYFFKTLLRWSEICSNINTTKGEGAFIKI